MPIFEFRCTGCGHQFEELVFGKEQENEILCPRCNRSELERILSIFSSGPTSSESGSASSGSGCASSTSGFS